jgi:DNA mismatch repair protein MutS
MMAQYLAIKQDHPDALLFFRMGDFYELFFEDAEAASAALDIVLTKRGRHRGKDIPMCGIPVHSSDSYLQRLIRRGFKVAVCEQVEDPAEAKKRGAKAVVNREVVRVVTPGTLLEDILLDARSNNYLVAVARAEGHMAVAWADVSTGDVSAMPSDIAGIGGELGRLHPGELLVSDRLNEAGELDEILADWQAVVTTLPAGRFDSQVAERRLKESYGVAALEGFGAFSRSELAALGGLLDYIELTQRGRLPGLKLPVRMQAGAAMLIDAATRRNLELSRNLSGELKGSLLSEIDHTVTGPGARLLARRLGAPLTDVDTISGRHDDVAFFVGEGGLRESIRQELRKTPDMERALSRLTLGRGGPRDLAALRDGLGSARALRDCLADDGDRALPAGVLGMCSDLGEHGKLIDLLTRALGEELPLQARDGNFVATGFNKDLDELRILRDESRRHIVATQATYAQETAIPSLKIRHNNVLGYFVEVTNTHADKLLNGSDERFIHRQTMVNAVRFTTTELADLEHHLSSAADRAVALEAEIFETLCKDVEFRISAIALSADGLACIDVTAALAELAERQRYARPVIDGSELFEVVGGRHPVVEAALERSGETAFVANDCNLRDGQRLWLMTGPNMAGKSTFLRQNAVIAIMAQMGSFVPADGARIGVIDRLFSRVGAADDLARGRSTFMVEMVETAAILNQAGPRALVILDEIGRGTATYDGLSIAWAVVEHLHEVNKCRALFATHYHELTALSSKLDHLANRTMRIKEWQGEVVFLHEVALGSADHSYGIHVAKLAGLPGSVIQRAAHVLEALETDEQGAASTRLAEDLPLFSAVGSGTARRPIASLHPLEAAIESIRPDELTPREALDLVYKLVATLRDSPPNST